MDARRLALPTYLLLWSVSQFASADVYRCVDPKTKAVTYSGARCTGSDAGKVSITDNAIMDGSKFRREQTARQMDEADGGDKNVPVRGKPRVESAPNRAQSYLMVISLSLRTPGDGKLQRVSRGLDNL